MPARLDPLLLRSFVATVDAGSLSRAGERLRLAQPTISLQVKRLEQALGHRLLDRSPHGLRLTAAGETLMGYARRILALQEEALASLAEPGVSGTVRLKLYKGSVIVTGRKSPNSLYSEKVVTFEDDAGAYDQRDAEGFIKLNALRLRLLGRRDR